MGCLAFFWTSSLTSISLFASENALGYCKAEGPSVPSSYSQVAQGAACRALAMSQRRQVGRRDNAVLQEKIFRESGLSLKHFTEWMCYGGSRTALSPGGQGQHWAASGVAASASQYSSGTLIQAFRKPAGFARLFRQPGWLGFQNSASDPLHFQAHKRSKHWLIIKTYREEVDSDPQCPATPGQTPTLPTTSVTRSLDYQERASKRATGSRS